MSSGTGSEFLLMLTMLYKSILFGGLLTPPMEVQILMSIFCSSYNGYLPAGERGRRRSKFVLYRRPMANGVRRSKHYVVKTPHSSKAILDASQHSISYTLSRSQAVIVEYTEDSDTDMFQVGGSSSSSLSVFGRYVSPPLLSS